ncbi:MAG: hypothetical protein ACPGN3_17925, partial [Opitutales bacterium]
RAQKAVVSWGVSYKGEPSRRAKAFKPFPNTRPAHRDGSPYHLFGKIIMRKGLSASGCDRKDFRKQEYFGMAFALM